MLQVTASRSATSTAEVCLAEIFHPWARWEGPGSGFESLSGAGASGVWNLGFCPLGIEVEKQGFRMAWLVTGRKFEGVGLNLTAFIFTF